MVYYGFITSPNPNYEEIMQWYGCWKKLFVDVTKVEEVESGFRVGLDVMNASVKLEVEREPVEDLIDAIIRWGELEMVIDHLNELNDPPKQLLYGLAY
jgi:hypothetical protein